MIGSVRTRKLFHLYLKIYFALSLGFFLWFGNKYGYTSSKQTEDLSENSVSFRMTLSVSNMNDNADDEKFETLPEKDFLENTSGETYDENENDVNDNVENENWAGFENYQEHSYEVKDLNVDRLMYNNDANDNYEMKIDGRNLQEVNAKDGLRKELGETFPDPKEMTFAQKWKRLIQDQNGLYPRPAYQRIKDAEVFYITAITTNLSRESNLAGKEIVNYVAINGWQGKKNKHSKLYCCFKGPESVTFSEVYKRHIWDEPQIKVITGAQYMCNISMSPENVNQTYVGLSLMQTCQNVEYVELEVETAPPSATNTSLAICGKIVYGNFPASRLIEWFEINKALGVDQISLFIYNITTEAKAVLSHYRNEGLLSFKEFDFPLKRRYPRYLGQKYMMAYMDEQITVFDCVRRFGRYTYLAVIDVDEFIMPKNGGTNIKRMMGKLLVENPSAAGFTLMTSIFVTDWGKTHDVADFTVGQYTLRTNPMWDRRKSIIISERVFLPSVWTHSFYPRAKFRRVSLSRTQAVLHHYRKCRSDWIQTDTCHNNRSQYQDYSMKKLLSNFRNTLLAKRKLLLNY